MTIKDVIENQKSIADELLALCETLDPTCILAGGAPRDWFFEKEAKDLDIFMYFRPDLSKSKVLRILKKHICDKIEPLDWSDEEGLNYERNPNIYSVYEFVFKGMKVQLVLLKKPSWDIVDTFAFNICKAWYKNKRCHYTKDFTKDYTSKTITKTGKLYACTEAYTQRIKSKFSDYHYVEE